MHEGRLKAPVVRRPSLQVLTLDQGRPADLPVTEKHAFHPQLWKHLLLLGPLESLHTGALGERAQGLGASALNAVLESYLVRLHLEELLRRLLREHGVSSAL